MELNRGPKISKGPRFYKGSSTETPWNKDMLWQLYVKREAHAMGFKSVGTCDHKSNENPDLPPHMRRGGLEDHDTGSIVYKLGLSPRPNKARGRTETGVYVPGKVHVTSMANIGLPLELSQPEANLPRPLQVQSARRADEVSAASDYSKITTALSRAIIEQRLKSAQDREDRLEKILQKQRGRREQVQKILDQKALAEVTPDGEYPMVPAAIFSASPPKFKGPKRQVAGPIPVKAAQHLKRAPVGGVAMA